MSDYAAQPGRPASISAVLPAHDEEGNIERVVGDLVSALSSVVQEFEVIVVDDGSTDHTGKTALRLAADDPRVRVVRHQKNQGYGAALRSGFEAARLDWIFFTDADGQFEVKEIERLVSYVPPARLVAGYRSPRMDPWTRRMFGRAFSALVRAAFKVRLRDVNCAFKLFDKSLIQGYDFITGGALINAELLVAARSRGAEPVEVAVTHKPRTWGAQSGGSPRVILRAAREFVAMWVRSRKG